MMKYTLRDYQQKAVDDITSYLKSKDKFKPSVTVMPVGSGKSIVIAELIRQLGNPKTVVFQPSKELLKQNYEKYVSQGLYATMYSASVNQKKVSNVTYVTPGSVKNSAKEFGDVDLILKDECHLSSKTGGMFDGFIKDLENILDKQIPVIGFTATPITLKSYMNFSKLNVLTRQRPKFWKKINHVTQIQTLYKGNYLTPLRYSTFNYDLRSGGMRGSDFDMEGVSKIIEQKGLRKFTIELINKCIDKGKKKILVFTPTVDDAYAISDKLDSSKVVSSKTKKKERERIVDNFVNGDLKVIQNFATLNTGFDAPKIDLIICLRPTQSYALWYQTLGRGNRLHEGKKVCDVIDLSGNYKMFGGIENMKFEKVKNFGWAVTVKDHIVTNIPVGQKIHKDQMDVLKRKITFGQYKGTAYKDIPTGYLKWISENFDLNTSFAKEKIVPSLKELNII